MNDRILKELSTKLQNASGPLSKRYYLEQISAECSSLKRQLLMESPSEQMSDIPIAPVPCDRINKLPDELLAEVLKIYMADQHVRRNADLMLVCKRWLSLVALTPLLWNRIEIAPHSSLRNIVNCTRLAAFCTFMSGGAPLDIIVDLSDLWDPKSHPHECIEPFLFLDWRSDDQNTLDLLSEFSVLGFIDYVGTLFGVLVGHHWYGHESILYTKIIPTPNRRRVKLPHMKRWRSLRIVLAAWMDDTDLSPFLTSMNHPAPMLETMEIHHDRNEEGMLDELKAVPPGPFPKLRTLSVNTGIDLSVFVRSHKSLLSMTLHVTPESFTLLSKFQNLCALHLTLGTRWIVPPRIPVDSISLPRLLILSLTGDHSDSLLLLIDAPKLESIRLSNFYVLDYPESNLFGHIRSLDWDIDLYCNDKDDIRECLSSVLKQCHELVKFTTWSAGNTTASNRMRKLVDDILAEQPLTSLKTVVYLERSWEDFDCAVAQEVVRYHLAEPVEIAIV